MVRGPIVVLRAVRPVSPLGIPSYALFGYAKLTDQASCINLINLPVVETDSSLNIVLYLCVQHPTLLILD